MDVSYSELRQDLKTKINRVRENHEPLFITSHKERRAVLIAYEDYQSLEETAYLLRSPAMARRLLEAVEDIKNGKNLVERELIEDEA